jgi:hypothetical protein
MVVHLAAASGWSPDATETQDAARPRRRRAQAARLASGPATCGPASRSRASSSSVPCPWPCWSLASSSGTSSAGVPFGASASTQRIRRYYRS